MNETAANSAPDPASEAAPEAASEAVPEAAPGTAPESSREARAALFRAHAAARFRLDTAEANRLAATLKPEHRMGHLLFQVSLFCQVVIDHFGDTPDPGDLAELTRRLHDKHFQKDPNFTAIKAEAMVRAVCDESILFTEIPQAEQPGYMWAVMNQLVASDIADADLAERFEVAEEVGPDLLKQAFEQETRA